MSQNVDLSLFPDVGHRFNDNLTCDMSHQEVLDHLMNAAIEWDSYNEPEVVYGILRELVWREPRLSSSAWLLLSKSAGLLGKTSEQLAARMNADLLAAEGK